MGLLSRITGVDELKEVLERKTALLEAELARIKEQLDVLREQGSLVLGNQELAGTEIKRFLEGSRETELMEKLVDIQRELREARDGERSFQGTVESQFGELKAKLFESSGSGELGTKMEELAKRLEELSNRLEVRRAQGPTIRPIDREILRVLETTPRVTANEIAADIGQNPKAVMKRLKVLAEAGKVEREGEPFQYFLKG